MAAIDSVSVRAKEHLPTVLLTLLSIVQALALELLWSHITSNDHLYRLTWLAVVCWIQVVATLLGVVLIWLIYTSMTMRFRWVPTISDSVFPFIIGLIEFALIAGLGPTRFGLWFLDLGLIFGVMTWVSQVTLRRARRDSENAVFFTKITPATLRDFYPAIATVTTLTAFGIAAVAGGETAWVVLAGLLFATTAIVLQLRDNVRFWNRSMGIE